MAVMKLSVEEWSKVPENPRQRDTTKRAKFARTKHLKEPHYIQRYVFGAVKNGKLICKLDGHTRSYLWDNAQLPRPSDGIVEVMVVEVKSLKEAGVVYSKLDNPKASESASDSIYGFARENKFELQSKLLSGCRFANQLRLADGFFRGVRGNSTRDIEHVVAEWKPYLLQLDGLGLTSKYTTLIGFMLIAIRKDGPGLVTKFMALLDGNHGTKNTRGMDGVEALHDHVKIRKLEKRMTGYGNLYDMTDSAWGAYRLWQSNKRTNSLKPYSIASELKGKVSV